MKMDGAFRALRVPVENLQKKVYSRERVSLDLPLGVGQGGVYQSRGSGDVHLEFVLESNPDGIWVRGKIEGWVSMECTRCLDTYHRELDLRVDEFYRRPGLEVVDELEGKLPRDMEVPEEDAYVIEDNMVDLYVLVNDAIMLSLPIKHLCSEECKGLCPVCGKNLNQGECGCVREAIDPRWEALRVLLKPEEDGDA
ncbi:MAG: DUF177 domain-containing protein [Candidatus Geothermincolales bacterium]